MSNQLPATQSLSTPLQWWIDQLCDQFAERPSRAEYAARFARHPELASILEEWAATPRPGGSAVARKQNSGLRIRCPHCHDPIEVVADTPVTDIRCSSCDSQFSLVADDLEANRTGTLWDIASRQETAILEEHEERVEAVAFSPDGETLATAGFDRKVILWEYASASREYSCWGIVPA